MLNPAAPLAVRLRCAGLIAPDPHDKRPAMRCCWLTRHSFTCMLFHHSRILQSQCRRSLARLCRRQTCTTFLALARNKRDLPVLIFFFPPIPLRLCDQNATVATPTACYNQLPSVIFAERDCCDPSTKRKGVARSDSLRRALRERSHGWIGGRKSATPWIGAGGALKRSHFGRWQGFRKPSCQYARGNAAVVG